MGRKKEETPEPAPAAPVQDEAKPEDPPVIKELKEIDDKYLAVEREYEKEVQELMKKYTEKQAPLLEKRSALLKGAADAEAAKTGTPALRGFWLQAMKNLPALEDRIEEWDEPVLEYLSDIQKTYLDETDLQKGFKLTFHFVENPYFTNDVIWKEYHTEESSPYTGEIDTTEIKASEIEWNPGKNVTVETIKKKPKGGGAKKAKQRKEKEEPRDSFFRNFFRNLKPDMPIPDDINLEEARGEDSEEEDDEQMMQLLMDNDYEMGCAVRDQLIPFAVRWYTGEAAPEDYDDDEDEEEEEDDDDEDEDDDEEEESEDEPAPKKKGQAPQGKRGGDDKKKQDAGAAGGKAEECKQQ